VQGVAEWTIGHGIKKGGQAEMVLAAPGGPAAMAPGALTTVAGYGVQLHGTYVASKGINGLLIDFNKYMSGTTSGSGGPSRTDPSMSPDHARKPRGIPEKPTDRGKVLENEAAEILSSAGYDIEQGPIITADDLAKSVLKKLVHSKDIRNRFSFF
jgi:hypothetical protein